MHQRLPLANSQPAKIYLVWGCTLLACITQSNEIMNKLVDPGMIVDALNNPGQMILQDVNKPISGARALGFMDLLLVQYLNRLEGQLIGIVRL